MKTLIIMRHAKSSWKDSSLSDFKRPLNERGRCDAPEMAKRLFDRGASIKNIIHSAALRTTQTAQLVSEVLGGGVELMPLQELYLASPDVILSVIHKVQDNSCDQLMIIGHNPGISEASSMLSGIDIGDAPTASFSIITFPVDQWDSITWGLGTLIQHDYPKKQD